ncbi:uncharacterized protein BYT42DRAFT_643006 [Radiomyces spectabilis]|uniref:uncharacterized protein n=1 Tax=Radiomyces spectabilis TaxID=64574 RepID=UPI00222050F5|nr:uncharacterized protein BYT42DRAFT_643006 [Radiomyces spectabilis]KAI8388856.1 hypothetical protein BYT42DRAFT_643006 [Radiomyces spectabilis]
MRRCFFSVSSIKTSIKAIGWREEFIQPLRELVALVHNLIKHTFLFAKYIFLSELSNGFELHAYVQEGFFVEVFLSLTNRRTRSSTVRAATRTYRDLTNPYVESFCGHASFTPPDLPNVQQIALYQVKQIFTAYINNIKERFGPHLRRLVNLLLVIKNRQNNLKAQLQNEGLSQREISARLSTKNLRARYEVQG